MKKLLFIGVLLATSAWGQYVPTVFTPNAVVGGTTLVKVGTFTKTTTTCVVGSTCPVSQAITGVGFTPKALIIWVGDTTNTGSDVAFPGASALQGAFGITTGTSNSYSGAWLIRAATNGSVGRYWGAKAISTVTNAAPPVVQSEADLTSFDSDGFTLSWTTQSNATGARFEYLAIGGTDVTAKVVECTANTSASDANCTGFGFQPTMFVVFSTSLATADGTAPVTDAALWSFGAATNTGAACANASQWGSGAEVQSGAGSNRTTYFRVDQTFLGITAAAAEDFRACLKTFIADGATLTWGKAAASAYKFAALGITGPHVAVGNWSKPTGAQPVTDSTVTGLGFAPAGAMAFSNTQTTSTAVKTNYSMTWGAFSGTTARSSMGGWKIQNKDVGKMGDVTNKVMSFVNCSTDCGTGSPAVSAQADVTSMDSGGWTWTWATNDANAWQIGYWTLGH